ncbi:UNVERIFIED_CONTAM: putative mitochondrial protein [Sesamum radiatum]|uniref:Mitochondrial protein n=1 Tax=Sesamum radiatum TaxID=300843 RepID=A0AAW2Q1J9_SESRA
MSVLAWNCRGLGGPWSIRTLGTLIRDNNPSLVFLAETKCSSRLVESLKRKFDMHGIGVSAHGRSGGLAVFWVKSANVQLQSYSQHHIDLSVQLEGGQPFWRFTGVYGEPDTSKRETTWNLLSRLHAQSCRAWLCAGDFNEILDNSEKRGGPLRPNWQIRNFRQALTACDLHDIVCTGDLFTWSNRQLAPYTVYERLDRGGGIADRLASCQQHLKRWNHQVFKVDRNRIQLLEDRLHSLLSGPITKQSQEESSQIRKEIEGLVSKEETKWRQRSKDVWLREGDRNTSFFHRQASNRFQSNLIRKLKGDDDEWVTSEEGIRQCISSHFQRVYASCRPTPDAIALGTDCLRRVVDDSMAGDLLQPYTAEEVTKALFQMAPLKSPGSDDRIISPVQSAFVPGRLITDNILLAFELNHFLNSKSKGGPGWMALKLDVSKAYDKVEWSFLEQLAEHEGRLKGVSICRGAPSISHLLFADDTLIFRRASPENTRAVLEVLESPDKLLSRVLRARYFPSGNLFEASLGSRPSFTWRSVMAALFLFRAGCRWRIGSGVHVRVWTDPWLPRPRSFRPITPPAPNLAHLLVSELIDPVSRDWKTELVERLFWPCDSSIILAIPLSRVGEGDLLTWHYSKNGSFTVRSAYHLAVSLTDTPCSSSRAAAETAWWRKVWQARVPSKVKVFIWRACLNALPTGVNLRKRASICQVMCPLCGDGSEDVLHVLLRCPFARQVWGLISLAADFKAGGKQGELLWMQSVASQLDAQSFGLFVCVCWALWWFRNRSAMEGERVTPVHVATFAPQFLNSFLHQAAASSSPPNSSTPSSWKAPPLEHVKINFDGAVVGEKSEMGIGVIARDSQGQCVAWMTHRIRRAGFGELAETWAAWEAIQFALRRGWRRVVVEGDCLNLIRKLNAGQGDLSLTGPLVLDIQYFAAKFSSCQFSWIKRSGNSVAHFLAQSANGYVEGGSIVPPSVFGLLSSDISN